MPEPLPPLVLDEWLAQFAAGEFESQRGAFGQAVNAVMGDDRD